jgi:3-oxoadipate enol-lactonase
MNHSHHGNDAASHSSDKSIEGVHYRVLGSGAKTVVLLRGLGRWSEHWLGFENFLAGKGIRVITIDNRGFGKSSAVKISRHQNIDEFADDVAHIISKEAPAGAHILGVSLGGMIALSLAAMKPQLVSSLMLVNSSVASSKLSRISGGAMFAIASVLVGSKQGYGRLAKILLAPDAPGERRSKMASEWATIDAATKPVFSHFWAQLMAANKFNGVVEMAAITCPVTVVKSEKDLFVDPANSEFIHKHVKGSVILNHSSAGHELVFDDPEWLANAILKQVNKTMG